MSVLSKTAFVFMLGEVRGQLVRVASHVHT